MSRNYSEEHKNSDQAQLNAGARRTYASNSEYGDAGDPHKERTVASDGGISRSMSPEGQSESNRVTSRPSTRSSERSHHPGEEINDLDYKDGMDGDSVTSDDGSSGHSDDGAIELLRTAHHVDGKYLAIKVFEDENEDGGVLIAFEIVFPLKSRNWTIFADPLKVGLTPGAWEAMPTDEKRSLVTLMLDELEWYVMLTSANYTALFSFSMHVN